MSAPHQCPNCALELTKTDKRINNTPVYHCTNCDGVFQPTALCNKCDSELEKLQACGAVNFFCNQCNELKSKSTVVTQFNPVT